MGVNSISADTHLQTKEIYNVLGELPSNRLVNINAIDCAELAELEVDGGQYHIVAVGVDLHDPSTKPETRHRYTLYSTPDQQDYNAVWNDLVMQIEGGARILRLR